MSELLVKLGASYLLGSVLGALVLGRLRGVDLRAVGSGNPGTANAWRSRGKGFAAAVFVIDFGKGWLATDLIARASTPGIAPAASWYRLWMSAGCGLAVVVGHVLPVFHRFRGGKGVATLLGAAAGILPVLLIPALLAWALVAMTTGYVALASVATALALAVAIHVLGVEPRVPVQVLGWLSAALVTGTHAGNLRRIAARREPRLLRRQGS